MGKILKSWKFWSSDIFIYIKISVHFEMQILHFLSYNILNNFKSENEILVVYNE